MILTGKREKWECGKQLELSSNFECFIGKHYYLFHEQI